MELQKLQNDVLGLCENVRIRDRATVEALHDKANLATLEQWWVNQPIRLMYVDPRCQEIRAEQLATNHANIKYVFKIPAPITNKYIKKLYKLVILQ